MSQSIYQKRRTLLLNKMSNNSIAFLATSKVAIRNNDTDYKYRPDSSFYYLTGFSEPESALALIKDESGVGIFVLFCRKKDPQKELWDGKRAGLDGAVETYGADRAVAVDDIAVTMPELMLGKDTVYSRFSKVSDNLLFANAINAWLATTNQLQRGDAVPTTLVDINPLINEMRLVKSDVEIELMQIAADVSAKAHIRAMKKVKPEMMEYALEAELLYVMQKSGCQTAYNSIVAGGSNGCILHYVDNNQALKDGDLVLIDAGAEYQNYAADITRTFPVNGKFTKPQKELYQIVLDAQLAAIESLKAGKGAKDYHYVAVKVIVKGLINLGLLTGSVKKNIEEETYKDFFMHGTGHWLGMDVHDVGSYNCKHTDNEYSPRKLKAGMVVTVEPGIYVAADNNKVPKKYRGIGIRIEDDVLITNHKPVVLTAAVPKTIEDIEKLMA